MNSESNLKNEECNELKNIKYKTMLLKGAPLIETKTANNISNLEKFLEDDKHKNQNEPWCKLNKTIKTRKLIDFAEIYAKDNELDDNEKDLLLLFFKDCLDRNKLLKVKDVVYDKIDGIIKNIPALSYVKPVKHFTLKNMDKRVSTLKSLAPKKTNNNTIKQKHKQNSSKNMSETNSNSDNED